MRFRVVEKLDGGFVIQNRFLLFWWEDHDTGRYYTPEPAIRRARELDSRYKKVVWR